MLAIFTGDEMRIKICMQPKDTGYQNPLCRKRAWSHLLTWEISQHRTKMFNSAIPNRNRNPQRTGCYCFVGCPRPVTKLHGVEDLRLRRSRRNNQIRTPMAKPRRTARLNQDELSSNMIKTCSNCQKNTLGSWEL